MKDATRIRIAAAVTTAFIGGLAATGVAMRPAHDAAPPPGTQAAAIAAMPRHAHAVAHAAQSLRTVTSRVSPSVGAQPAAPKPVGRRSEREPGSEALLD
jgi:hypothetical protein